MKGEHWMSDPNSSYIIPPELLRGIEEAARGDARPRTRRARSRSWWRGMVWRIKVLFTGDCGCW